MSRLHPGWSRTAAGPLRRPGAVLAACAAASLAAGCGGGADAIAACRARQPGLPGGVHGCVTSSQDVGNTSSAPLAGFAVEVFSSAPPPTPGDGLPALARGTTDDMGFYEIALPSGDCWICTAFRRCVAVAVPPAGSVALDYDVGVGPGWSPR